MFCGEIVFTRTISAEIYEAAIESPAIKNPEIGTAELSTVCPKCFVENVSERRVENCAN